MSGVVERSRSMRVGGPVVGALLGAAAALGVHGRHAEADAGTHAGAGGVVGPGPALQTQHHDSAHGPTPPYTTRPGPVSGPTLLDASALAIQNANLSPVRFPGGKNPYLDRPLPPPPPPKPQRNARPPASIVMPARPSTSSGPPADKMSGGLSGLPTRPNWDKRMSRDDMYLTRPLAPLPAQKKGLQPYRIGVKGALLPTPEPSPNAAPSSMPTSASIPARMPTPESLSSGEIQIGMALGSPVHAPSPQPAWVPQPLQTASSPPPSQVAAPMPQRTKTQKRRLFGGLFGRKHSEPAPAASGSTESVVSVTTTTTQSYASSTPTRSVTVSESRSASRHKPIVIRSNTAPMASPNFEATGSTAPALEASAGGPSLLDVEIPDIRLERYSIMFSGLLNPQGTQATPSLLQRRQATLEKLKTINDSLDQELELEKEKVRQRRATSPQPTKSPAGFTLFPSTPGREAQPSRLMPAPAAAPRRLSPRSRSNTSPALLPSPSKPTFASSAPPPKKEKKTVKIVSPRTMDEQNRAANVERLREQQAQQAQQARQQAQTQTIVVQDKGFHFGPDESGLILDSPQSMDDEEVVHSRADKPAIPEPQWQMVSPPSSSASSVTAKRSPSSASSVQTTVTRPSLDGGEAALQAAVEISIARQISVSRQQRQLLVPLQTNVAQFGTRSGSAAMARAADRSPNSAASASRSPINKLGRNERVVETKFSTPTLVVPRDNLENQLAQHRKSERVVLES